MSKQSIILGIAVLLLLLTAVSYATDGFGFLAGAQEPTPQVVILRNVFIDLNQDQHPDLLLYGEAILDEGGTLQEATK